MKMKIWYLAILVLLASCSKNDGSGSSSFYFSTYNGEITLSDQYQPMAGVTVKAYSSAQAWVDGDAPLKTFTTDSKGEYASNDEFTIGTIFYAELGNYNNWPGLFAPTLWEGDGSVSGNAILYSSFLQDFEGISGKSFVLSDLVVDGASIFANVSDCSKDNFVTITKGLKLTISEGASVCSGATASHEYTIGVGPKKYTGEDTVNGISVWQFGIPWAEAGNVCYISKDFTKIMFKAWSESGQPITVYTLQN